MWRDIIPWKEIVVTVIIMGLILGFIGNWVHHIMP